MSDEAKAPATRRRGLRLEEAILDAAWALLVDVGYHAFTYEAVATRAGTSRPVLYRRWPKRHELLLAAMQRFWQSHPIIVPDTGSLRADIISLLQNAEIGRVRMLMLASMQLTDFLREAGVSLSEFRAALQTPSEPSACEVIVKRAIERGELADVARSSRAVNLPFDLFRHEVFMTMRTVPDEAITEIVDQIWLPLLSSNQNPR